MNEGDANRTARTTILVLAAAAGPVALGAAILSGGVEGVAMLAMMGAILYLVSYAMATPAELPATLDRVMTHLTAVPDQNRAARRPAATAGPATLQKALGTPLTDAELSELIASDASAA